MPTSREVQGRSTPNAPAKPRGRVRELPGLGYILVHSRPAPGQCITVDHHQARPSFFRSQKPLVRCPHHLWLSDLTCHLNTAPSTVASYKPFPLHFAEEHSNAEIFAQKAMYPKGLMRG